MRRMIYGRVERADVTDGLVNFDFENPDLPSGRRHETTVPQQALFLMNSPLIVEQAKKLVTLADFNSCQDDAARIQFLYEKIYQRPPRPEEIRLGEEFVSQTPDPTKAVQEENPVRPISNDGKKFNGKGKRAGEPKKRQTLKALEEYAHALFPATHTSF